MYIVLLYINIVYIVHIVYNKLAMKLNISFQANIYSTTIEGGIE